MVIKNLFLFKDWFLLQFFPGKLWETLSWDFSPVELKKKARNCNILPQISVDKFRLIFNGEMNLKHSKIRQKHHKISEKSKTQQTPKIFSRLIFSLCLNVIAYEATDWSTSWQQKEKGGKTKRGLPSCHEPSHEQFCGFCRFCPFQGFVGKSRLNFSNFRPANANGRELHDFSSDSRHCRL